MMLLKLRKLILILSALVWAFVLNGCSGKTIAAQEADQSAAQDKGGAATVAPQDENGNDVDNGTANSDEAKSHGAQAKEAGQNQSSSSADASNSNDVSKDLYHRFEMARKQNDSAAVNQAAGEILSRNPGDVRVLNSLAAMAVQQEKYDLARLYISKVLARDPNNGAAYNNRGVIELKTDNLRLALEQFKRATEVDSKNRAAHANLGAIYLKYRNYQNASQELQVAVDNGDQSPDTLSNLGFALTGIADYTNAEKYYQKALAKDSNNMLINLNLATLLIEKTHKYKEGIKLLNKIRFIAHEPAILDKVEILLKKAENPGVKTGAPAGVPTESEKGVSG
jgi:Tfp pilus assembly protein PilF